VSNEIVLRVENLGKFMGVYLSVGD
jgi:hypothetical protein